MHQESPTASMLLASSHTAVFVASETQYATKFQVVQVRWFGGTGSMSLLLHRDVGAKVDSSGSRAQRDGRRKSIASSFVALLEEEMGGPDKEPRA